MLKLGKTHLRAGSSPDEPKVPAESVSVGLAEPAEGQQTATTQMLEDGPGGFESPTLKLSGATLTSSIRDTGSEIRFSEF